MKRRQFIKTGIAAGAMAAVPLVGCRRNTFAPNRLTRINHRLAIAMWDFSWLLRHHRLGSFEDWDRVLDELAERGYNAIRMDCFPHLVAAGEEADIVDEFYHPKNDWHPALWGNQYSIHSRPREALLEFLPKCRDRGIHVGLATWMLGHGTDRNKQVMGLEGFVRVWDETLRFLDDHDLLRGILYVDVLNEYPLWHGFDWLKDELNRIGNGPSVSGSEQEANIPESAVHDSVERKYSPLQEQVYKTFMTEALRQLQARWPGLDFFASLTMDDTVPWQENDFSQFSALDTHLWFVQHPEFARATNYWRGIQAFKNDLAFEKTCRDMNAWWQQNKAAMISWMDDEIALRADFALAHNLVCGNTEGWGAILWNEHPSLEWSFIKEAGSICADLCMKHGYRFICTSNFTHPHFAGIWNDVRWHRDVTRRIRQV